MNLFELIYFRLVAFLCTGCVNLSDFCLHFCRQLHCLVFLRHHPVWTYLSQDQEARAPKAVQGLCHTFTLPKCHHQRPSFVLFNKGIQRLSLCVFFLSLQVPIFLPILVLIAAIFLVLAPIIDEPQIEYLYVSLFIVSGAIIYVPFIHYKLCPGLLRKLTVFLQLFLEVAPAEKNLWFLPEKVKRRVFFSPVFPAVSNTTFQNVLVWFYLQFQALLSTQTVVQQKGAGNHILYEECFIEH